MTASSNTKAKNLTNKLNLIMFEFFLLTYLILFLKVGLTKIVYIV